MKPDLNNSLDLDELLEVINNLNTILSSEQTLNECTSTCHLTRLPLRLQVWAQDYKYQLSRLKSIRDELVGQATSKCGNSKEGHQWTEDFIELNNGDKMQKIIYCSKCELQN